MASATSVGQSLKLYQCDPCKSEGKQIDAEFQCINCEEALCSICRDAHKKFPKLRDHEIQRLSSNPPICTTCKSGDIVRQASFFCKDCDECLCDACKNDHKKFKKLRGHVIAEIKEKKKEHDKSKHTGPSLSDISRLQISGPETVGLHTPPTDGSRNGRGLHATAPTEIHLSTESKDSPTSTSPSEPFDILNMSLQTVDIIKDIGVSDKSMRVHGCVFMPNGELLLVNVYQSEVLHLDSSFTIRERLNLPSTDEIAVLSENVAIVTSGNNLVFLEVTPKLRIIKSVPLVQGRSGCIQGVAAGGGFIYVPCHEGDDDKGHIKVLDNNGKEIRTIAAVQNDQVLFDQPHHVAASTTRVYVCGEALTCFKSDGTLVYQYKNEELGKVSGMFVDSEDNVLACAYGSKSKANDKFHVITANGERHRCKGLEKSIAIPGYNCGDCIAIRPSDRTLAMGALSDLYIFKMA